MIFLSHAALWQSIFTELLPRNWYNIGLFCSLYFYDSYTLTHVCLSRDRVCRYYNNIDEKINNKRHTGLRWKNIINVSVLLPVGI